MKRVCTSVRPEAVAPIVDILRTLGYAEVSADRAAGEPEADLVRLEVLVRQVEATRAVAALSRATAKDPHPIVVDEAVPPVGVGAA